MSPFSLRPGLRRRAATLVGVAALLTGAFAAGPGSAAVAASGCAVAYTPTAFWGTGFQAGLTLTPGNAVTSWTADFDLADQQLLTFTYGSSFVQSGRHVRLTNVSFNGTVAAGASVNTLVAINTNPTLTNVPPGSFAINGQACAYTPPPYIVPSQYQAIVPEGGSVGIGIRLSQAPPTTITLTVGGASSGPTFFASPTSLTFTPANWSVPQIVTVTSPKDADTTNQLGYLAINQQNYVPGAQHIAAFPSVTQRDAG